MRLPSGMHLTDGPLVLVARARSHVDVNSSAGSVDSAFSKIWLSANAHASCRRIKLFSRVTYLMRHRKALFVYPVLQPSWTKMEQGRARSVPPFPFFLSFLIYILDIRSTAIKAIDIVRSFGTRDRLYGVALSTSFFSPQQYVSLTESR